jgi:hypothetical protein
MSKDETYSSFLSFVPTSGPADSLNAVADETVRSTAAVFAKNFDDVSEMFAFPIKLTYVCLSGQRHMIDFMEACMKGGLSAAKYGRDPETTRRIKDEMAKIGATAGLDWIATEARKLLLPMLQNPEIAPGIRVFVSSLMSASWTAFEAMASDLWTTCVNSRPSQLGNHLISNLPRKTRDGAERYISLRLLSKYQFDLGSSLGTVLSRRFDFTSLSGIAAAYRAAFAGLNAREILDDPDLKLLQAYRHAIVHRAGIADQGFTDTTKLPGAIAGRAIPIEDKSIARMINSAGECGSRLITSVDQWLTQHPL